MNPSDTIDNLRNPHIPNRSDDTPRIVRPARAPGGFFPGWGPKLLAIASALLLPAPIQLATPAGAAAWGIGQFSRI